MQSFEKPRDPGHHSHVSEACERVSTFKSDTQSGRGVQDRPKLNLKPRMQPLDQLERNMDTKRFVNYSNICFRIKIFWCYNLESKK